MNTPVNAPLNNPQADIHLSIVSHGQWPMITQLLDDLCQLDCYQRLQLTITLNIKETYELLADDYPLAINIIENSVAKGFGENHNAAFKQPPNEIQRRYFLVINPDIRIHEAIFSPLIHLFETADDTIGVLAPAVKNNDGQLEDSARELPTPGRIMQKALGRYTRWQHNDEQCYQPDWIAGMFMLFKADVYAAIGGFNEAYFLYYEDVELCSRLWLNNYSVVVEPGVSVIHNAQRSSHRQMKYLRWHISSMLRFFLSNVFRRVKSFHQQR